MADRTTATHIPESRRSVVSRPSFPVVAARRRHRRTLSKLYIPRLMVHGLQMTAAAAALARDSLSNWGRRDALPATHRPVSVCLLLSVCRFVLLSATVSVFPPNKLQSILFILGLCAPASTKSSFLFFSSTVTSSSSDSPSPPTHPPIAPTSSFSCSSFSS